MADATGKAKWRTSGVTFDRRIKLELHSAGIIYDNCPLAYREQDHALDPMFAS